jgi:hypothetical protein
MELVMLQHSKYTGKKKPLSSLVTEVTLPKGGVLADIIVRLWRQSNLVTSKQSSILQVCGDINLFNYMLIDSIKNYQHIEPVLNKYLMPQLLQSATIAEN